MIINPSNNSTSSNNIPPPQQRDSNNPISTKNASVSKTFESRIQEVKNANQNTTISGSYTIYYIIWPFRMIGKGVEIVAEFIGRIFDAIGIFFAKLFCCTYCKTEPAQPTPPQNPADQLPPTTQKNELT